MRFRKPIAEGTVFGKLTVRARTTSFKKKTGTEAGYLCQCTCGRVTTVRRNNLITGNTKSCGCGHGKMRNRHDELFALREKGWSFSRIARKFGCSTSAVCRMFRKLIAQKVSA